MKLTERLAGLFGYERAEATSSVFDDAVAAMELEAGAGLPTNPGILGTIECVAALWGRTLAAAEVTPDLARDALSPDVLERVGRELLYRGHYAGLLAVRNGSLALDAVTIHDIRGNTPDPASWRYTLHLDVPNGILTRQVIGSDILHVVYGSRSTRSWAGRSPLRGAGREVAALGGIMRNVEVEAKAKVGTIHRIRANSTGAQWKQMVQFVKGIDGKTGVFPLGLKDEGHGQPTDTLRLGFQPTEEAREWAAALERRIYAAAGVPPQMFGAGEGTAAREAFRRFVATTVSHLGRLVSTEASRKLGTDVSLKFERLRSADAQGMGRALKALTDAGVSLPDALEKVGLT